MVTVSERRRPVPLPPAGDAAGLRPRAPAGGRRRRGARPRHAHYFAELAEQAAARAARAGRAGLGRARPARLRQPARRRSSTPSPTATATWRCGWSRRRPSWCTCASATSRPTGPSARSTSSTDDHPLCAAAVGVAARGAWNRGEFAARRGLAERAGGRRPGRGTGRDRLPRRRARRRRALRGRRRARRWGTTRPRWSGPAATTTRSGWSGRSTTSRCATRCCAHPERRHRRRAGGRRGRRARPPTRRRCRWPATRSGWCSRSPSPDRALALFDEAAELAASVRNFWWHGIALMEAAATRAVHGDPAEAARRVPRRARPLGPGRRLDPAVAEPALRRAAAGPARRRRRRGRAAPRARRGGQAVPARPGPPRGVGRLSRPGAVRRRGPARLGARRDPEPSSTRWSSLRRVRS